MKKLLLVGLVFSFQLSYASENNPLVKIDMSDRVIWGTLGASNLAFAGAMIKGAVDVAGDVIGTGVVQNADKVVIGTLAAAVFTSLAVESLRHAYYGERKKFKKE